MKRISQATAAVMFLAVLATLGTGQEKAYRVTIKDGPTALEELTLPIDPTIRITPAHANGPQFGLTVEGKRITCSQNGSIWHQVRIDGNAGPPLFVMGGEKVPQPLADGPNKKKRHGFQTSWAHGSVEFTMIVEVVPSKPFRKIEPGAKRRMDTCRMTYIAENKDTRPHTVEFRTNIDMLIVNNDGALYASPTTEPGKVLNGVVLKDDKLPEYVLALERPDANNPGFAACMTLKFGKSQNIDGPNKIVLTNLGVIGQGEWECPAQPAGDSACAIYWGSKEIRSRNARWSGPTAAASRPAPRTKAASPWTSKARSSPTSCLRSPRTWTIPRRARRSRSCCRRASSASTVASCARCRRRGPRASAWSSGKRVCCGRATTS
jgi:hypothetical protein